MVNKGCRYREGAERKIYRRACFVVEAIAHSETPGTFLVSASIASATYSHCPAIALGAATGLDPCSITGCLMVCSFKGQCGVIILTSVTKFEYMMFHFLQQIPMVSI